MAALHGMGPSASPEQCHIYPCLRLSWLFSITSPWEEGTAHICTQVLPG